ncbi:MAG: hypothetical protein M1817_000793 [Caeruleum heppii]|nr:MAG: hypothetical protein M1817_000793 [Caeruleum heppii]
MAFSVAGKTAIVTGAGSGINLAFAKLLLSRNCSVVLADLALRPEAVSVVSSHASPRTSTRPQAVFQQTDVTKWSHLSRMFTTAVQTFGGVDIVCPGAGVYEPLFSNFWHPPRASSLSKDDPQQSRYRSLDINLTHPIRTTQLAISHFLDRFPRSSSQMPASRGTVIHTSSIAAQLGPPPAPLYSAAKAGVSNFVRSLALLSPIGIRVSAVAPGIIKTPLWTENPDKLKMIDDTIDEWVSPEDVAEVMLDLIENEQHLGGTILEVGKHQVRRVEALNDLGPSGAGHTAAGINAALQEILETLGEEHWGKERE